MPRKYVFHCRIVSRLGDGVHLRCYRCGEFLHVGDDVVVSKRVNDSVELYHKVCFDSLFVDA